MSVQIAFSQPVEPDFRFVAGFRVEHRLDSLHFAVYECVRHRLPPFSVGGYRAGLPDAHILLDSLCLEVGFPYRY